MKLKDKRGFGGVIMFFGILLILLFIGFIATAGLAIIDFGSDTITPITEDLGIVSGANVSEAAENTFGVLDTTIQSLSWVVGFLFVSALTFSIFGVVTSISGNISPIFMGVFAIMGLLLIFGAILVSNIYEDIYTGDNEISERLKEQTLSSYFLLQAPWVVGLIIFIGGIFIFARPFSGSGGFGL